MLNKNVLDTIKNDNLFRWGREQTTFSFFGPDTEELYKKNLINQPQDWYYRNNSVTYTCNKDSYRAPELDTIDWSSAVLLFGCSNTFGVGLDDKDTISAQLESIIGLPVINLGVGGSSNDLILHNSTLFRDKGIIPKGVVHLWSIPQRTVLYQEENAINCGNWGPSESLLDYTKSWLNEHYNILARSLINYKLGKLIWQNTSASYYDLSVYKETATLLECDYIQQIDDARDVDGVSNHVGSSAHIGRRTARIVAQKIADNLKL